eukprot:1766543-Alexandrium_andersonii.AAC.1
MTDHFPIIVDIRVKLKAKERTDRTSRNLKDPTPQQIMDYSEKLDEKVLAGGQGTLEQKMLEVVEEVLGDTPVKPKRPWIT